MRGPDRRKNFRVRFHRAAIDCPQTSHNIAVSRAIGTRHLPLGKARRTSKPSPKSRSFFEWRAIKGSRAKQPYATADLGNLQLVPAGAGVTNVLLRQLPVAARPIKCPRAGTSS